MADTENGDAGTAPAEPQARHIVYCGGKRGLSRVACPSNSYGGMKANIERASYSVFSPSRGMDYIPGR